MNVPHRKYGKEGIKKIRLLFFRLKILWPNLWLGFFHSLVTRGHTPLCTRTSCRGDVVRRGRVTQPHLWVFAVTCSNCDHEQTIWTFQASVPIFEKEDAHFFRAVKTHIQVCGMPILEPGTCWEMATTHSSCPNVTFIFQFPSPATSGNVVEVTQNGDCKNGGQVKAGVGRSSEERPD